MVTKTKQLGVTLIELLIVICILGIMSAVSAGILSLAFRNFRFDQNLVFADEQGQIAFNRMTRDIRNLTAIITATQNTFAFSDNTGNNITYTLGGAQNNQLIYSDTTHPNIVLADYIKSLHFTYYDQNGNDLGYTSTAGIRYITITMNLVLNDVNFNMTTTEYLWNLTN